MDSIRSFVSLNIESSLIQKLSRIQDELKILLSEQRVKWENPSKFHLTLRFLGDIETNKLKDISAELGQICLGFDKIMMTTSGIGFFPNQRRPNVVFIDLADEENLSEELVSGLDGKLGKFGFLPDKKFVPHVTVGRFRRENKKRIDEQIKMKVEQIDIIFDSFFLMKSVLKPTGSEYEILREFKFNK